MLRTIGKWVLVEAEEWGLMLILCMLAFWFALWINTPMTYGQTPKLNELLAGKTFDRAGSCDLRNNTERHVLPCMIYRDKTGSPFYLFMLDETPMLLMDKGSRILWSNPMLGKGKAYCPVDIPKGGSA